jgi:hypothetical protein
MSGIQVVASMKLDVASSCFADLTAEQLAAVIAGIGQVVIACDAGGYNYAAAHVALNEWRPDGSALPTTGPRDPGVGASPYEV